MQASATKTERFSTRSEWTPAKLAPSGLSSSNDYLRPRYSDPKTGRFLTLDPFAGDPTSPLSLHKYNYAHSDPVNNIDPTGRYSLGQTLATIGIGLNVVNLAFDIYRTADATSRGDTAAASESAAWAMVDALFLALPFSGPGAGALRTTIGTTTIQLSRAGVQASAVWGYVSSLLHVARFGNFSFATSAGGGPGAFEYSEGPGEWRSGAELGEGPGRAFQSSRTGKPADWIYWLNGVKFDGFRSTGNTLLETKNNGWEWLLQQEWFIKSEVGGLPQMAEQARRQIAAAKGSGARVIWEVQGQGAAQAIEDALRRSRVPTGPSGITVVPIP